MKKTILLTLANALLCMALRAQTNTFPASGNVGIGTTSPNSFLQVHVADDSKPGNVSSATQSVIKISRTGTPNYSYNEAAEFRIGHGGPSVWGSKLDLYVNGANNQTNVPDRHAMTWLYNGNVGIGTDSPASRLEVSPPSGNYSASGTFHLNGGQAWGHAITLTTDGSGGNDDARLLFSYRNKVKQWAIGGGNNTTNFGIWEDAGDGIYGTGFGNQRFVVLPGGNIGIGTSTPNEKLSVNGKIRAHEIKVETANWPDYVFDQDYKILGLQELDTYIKANKHLPEMPSAKETQINGVELGEMNKLLLKKVEELTLHLIEKDKQLKLQAQKNAGYESRLLELEKKIK